ncbi:MAG: antitoxin [Lautropia sp.]|nr:antitoxin [Lautropia sp.]
MTRKDVLMWVCSIPQGDVMGRLTIDMTDQQHQSLKAMAALQGKTIKQYALERLFPGDTDADQAWQELKRMLRQRIDDGLAGKVSDRSMDEILEDELSRERF